jgi:LIM domain-binding protein 1
MSKKYAKKIFENFLLKICTDGHFNIEFTFDDLMRIKSWHFSIKQHRELIPRSVVAIPVRIFLSN